MLVNAAFHRDNSKSLSNKTNAVYSSDCLPTWSKTKKRSTLVESSQIQTEKVDYGLRPAHSTCREWLPGNISLNNPENLSQQVCNEVRQEKWHTTWGTDLGLPGGKLTPPLVFTRSCRDGVCCSVHSVTVLQNSLSALKELEAKDRAMMWSVCEHKHGAWNLLISY